MKQTSRYIIFLSIIAAIGGLLFGYDTAVISGTIEQVTRQFQLNAVQQGWYVGCALIGSIFGVLVAGVFSDKFGRKSSLLFSGLLFLVSGLGCTIAVNIDQLVIYRIIGGVAIGMVSIISPMYISEIAIAKNRGQMVALYQLAITIGFLAAYFVNYLLLKNSMAISVIENDWLQMIFKNEVWRSMLGMESLPAFLFIIVICIIPESPRWLILNQKTAKAKAILHRLYGNATSAGDLIKSTLASAGGRVTLKGTWNIVIRPPFRKAIVIGVAIAILGQFMGVNAVLYYGPTIFAKAGLSSGDSLYYQTLVGLVNMLTTVLALLIIDRVGRKKLVYFGVTGMILSLLFISLYFWHGEDWKMSSYYLLVFFLTYIFCCAISVCAVAFVLLSEIFPNRIRAVAMSIAGFALWVGTFLIGQLTPWMLATLSPEGTFMLFAVMCVPYIWIIWRALPETTGKTLEEIERLWV